MNLERRAEQSIPYLVSNLKGMADYANALALISQQLGRDFPHNYRFDESAQRGAMTFVIPVEIDLHPLKKAGYTAKKLSQ